MAPDDKDGETTVDTEQEALISKIRLWVETPDGERVWLDDWLKTLPPGTQVRMRDTTEEQTSPDPNGTTDAPADIDPRD